MKCLRLLSHAKSYCISFRFTPKLSVISDQVVVFNQRKAIFHTHYCRNKLQDPNKGKNGDLQNLSL